MATHIGILASMLSAHLSSFESIQTVTVGAGGASPIDFTSIPATYKHLQIRCFAQTNRATFGGDTLSLRLGTPTIDTGTNYSYHELAGNGSSAAAGNGVSANSILLGSLASIIGTAAGGTFGVALIDILDYANTNKNKTVRCIGGVDDNGGASFGNAAVLASGAWLNTGAVQSIRISPLNGTLFNQYSSFALYGSKG